MYQALIDNVEDIVNRGGRFVVRQRFSTVGHKGLRINRGASDNKGISLFAHAFRGDTDHCRLDYCWMPVEPLFNTAWVDIKPAANNQVLLTFNNVQVTVFVKASHITGIQPAIA